MQPWNNRLQHEMPKEVCLKCLKSLLNLSNFSVDIFHTDVRKDKGFHVYT